VTVNTLTQLYASIVSAPPSYTLVVGQTSSGIYPMPVPKLYINVLPVPDLYGIMITPAGLVIGASETLQVFVCLFVCCLFVVLFVLLMLFSVCDGVPLG
jgi:hypothetical protein